VQFKHFLALAILVTGVLIFQPDSRAAEQKKSTATAKKGTAKSSTSKAPAKKGTTTAKKPAVARKTPVKGKATTARRSSKYGSRKVAAAPARPRGQIVPTPERYKEIQQALFDRGFMSSPPTGIWGPDSAQALKNFQQNQKIQSTGKLDSMTIIALGLGPKRNATAQVRPTNDNRSTEGNQRP
jgi:peptidoglycan hydrolase-like protein with peptidoglycan-binding domain